MSSKPLLVEIGTEELPPRALRSLAEAFAENVRIGLVEQRLGFGAVRPLASPRRLAVIVEDVQLVADDEAIEVFGPPADRARTDDGGWTPAAEGFARKHGVTPADLEIAETDKGARLAYRSTAAGISAESAIPALLVSAIRDLPIPKRMRWGASRSEFVRPAHWLVVLLGDAVVDCELLGLQAGRETRGHRFHSPEPISLSGPADYEAALESAYVIADFDRRRALVREQVEACAGALNAHADIDEDLLDEVTALVEWPVALTGSFEERFLAVPQEALVSSMKSHQKYFPVLDNEGCLLPHFIFVSNIESTDPAQVIDGNERVIRPRLADAAFFFSSDKQHSLASRVERLKSIVFQQQLGTLHDKTRRLQTLAAKLAPRTGATEQAAVRAALLSKTDLLTEMVTEFADLQGIAGRYYAQNDGEPAAVADALEQQYWPRFAGDCLPDGPVATTLALADRLDTLVGIFGIGQTPTGSRDPFALRRASLGVLRLLVEKELDLDLEEMLTSAARGYPAGCLDENAVAVTMSYVLDRFRAWYEDRGIPVEVFKAVSAKSLSVPLDIDRRVHAVHAFTALPEAASLAAANKRVSNILTKQASGFNAGEVSKDLLTEPAEQRLASELAACRPHVTADLGNGEYTRALTALACLQSPVDAFFDEVMVMAEDEAVRHNRLNLLQELRSTFLEVADISQLVTA